MPAQHQGAVYQGRTGSCVSAVTSRLMQMMIGHPRAEGLLVIEGQVLQENRTMLRMCREFGIDVATDPSDPELCLVRLKLAP